MVEPTTARATGGERRLRIVLGAHEAEGLASFFELAGALEVLLEPQGGGDPKRAAVTVRLLADEPPFVEDRVEAWLNVLDPRAEATLETAAGDGPWEPGWRAIYRGATVGSFHVRPPWVPAAPDRLSLVIDPRGAFGSGLHPATEMTLRALEAELRRSSEGGGGGGKLLDVGAGSGILSVAGARLGFAVTAVEIEPAARAACRRTAEANGVAAALRVLEEPIEALDEPFDVVVANLNSDALRTCAPAIRGAVGAGGTLIIAGYHPHEQEAIAALYPDLERAAALRSSDDDWAGLVLRRPAATGA